MDQWFYSVSEERKGPVSGEGLRKLLETREIPLASSLWKEGMTDWVPASSIAELQPSPYASPALVTVPDIHSGDMPEGSQIRPWVRFFARLLDVYLFCTILEFIQPLLVSEVLETSWIWFGMILILGFCFVEAFLLSVFGTTPFKALLNVRVRKTDGSNPTYLQALHRSFRVFVFGLGCWFPIVMLFTLINSYQLLTNRGTTNWDSAVRFTVSHRKIAFWRWLIVALFILIHEYLTP